MDPPTTLLSLILWVGAAMGAAVLTWQRQILGFGVLWFLWGQVLESSVIPMALAFEHRNYLPAYGLLLAFVGILYAALCHIRIEFKARTAILVAVLAVLPAYQLHERVKVWSSEAELAAHSVEQQPTSPLTLLRAAGYLANKGDGTAAIIAVRAAQELDSRDAAFVFADLTLHCLFRPHAEVEPRLERMLASVSTYNVRTAVSRQQFMQVQKTCNDVSGLDEILSGLYARLRDHPDREIALASLLGSAAIRYRRGELELALRSWEAAIRAFPEARFLKPRAKALRDRLESGEQDTGPSD
jgi:tetratricopeptide (TPR) repeat protein